MMIAENSQPNQSIESSGRFSHMFSVFVLGFLIQISFN